MELEPVLRAWRGRVIELEEFTKAALLALEPQAKRYAVGDPDDDRLALVIFPSGVRTWYVSYRDRDTGTHEREKVGRFPDLPIREARRKALALLGQAAGGVSPSRRRREAKAKAQAATPVREAWTAYKANRLAHADERRKRAVRFEEWQWRKHVEPTFGARPVDSVTRSEVSRWFVALTASGGPVAANRSRAVLSGIFSFWAGQVETDLANPCAKVRRNPEDGRNRYLAAGELRAWWAAVLGAAGQDTGELLACLTLTAARQGTLRAIR